jgi:hypothetical protein
MEDLTTGFQSYNKIPRLARQMIITEKIDGTNAQVYIAHEVDLLPGMEEHAVAHSIDDRLHMFAGSRKRWIQPGRQKDNAGFAAFVFDYAHELFELGPGRHYGEWWGQGIRRGYNQEEKHFSLFNSARWTHNERPECCGVVPVLYEGDFNTFTCDEVMEDLRLSGSQAALGYDKPEGIVVFHKQANLLFKKTFEMDGQGKGVDKAD